MAQQHLLSNLMTQATPKIHVMEEDNQLLQVIAQLPPWYIHYPPNKNLNKYLNKKDENKIQVISQNRKNLLRYPYGKQIKILNKTSIAPNTLLQKQDEKAIKTSGNRIRDGSAVSSIHCFSRGLKFGSQHPHSDSMTHNHQ